MNDTSRPHDEPPSPTERPGSLSRTEPRRKRRVWALCVVALLALLLSAGLVAWFQAGNYRVLGQHPHLVRSLAFSPDGKTLYSASRHQGQAEGAVQVRDVRSGQEQHRIPAGEVMALSPDGQLLAARDQDPRQVNLWDVTVWQKRMVLQGTPTAFQSLAFSPDSKSLASAGGQISPTDLGELHLWEVTTGKMIRRFDGHDSQVSGVAFSPDGKLLASSGWDKSVRLWDVSDGNEVALLIGKGNDRGVVQAVAFSPDGRYLAAAAQGPVLVWEVATRKLVTTLEWQGYGWPTCLLFSPDGQLLAVGGQYRQFGYLPGGLIESWEVGSWRQLNPVKRHRSMVVSIAISADGSQLATGSFDGQVGFGRIPR